MTKDTYESPLNSRYASKEMQYIFSPDKKFRTVEFRDDQRGNYEKYYFHNNRLEGVILVGDTDRMIELSEKVNKHATYKEMFGRK